MEIRKSARASARTHWLGLALLAGLVGCGPKKETPATGETVPAPESAAPETPAAGAPAIFAIYEGTLPCADCSGIRTELTLFTDGTRFAMKQTYLGTKDGDRVFDSTGSWATARGAGADTTALIYVVDPGDPAKVQRFLVVSDREIELLDRDGKRITSEANHTLTRKEADAG